MRPSRLLATLTVAGMLQACVGNRSGPAAPVVPELPPTVAPVATVGLSITSSTLVPAQTLRVAATPRDAQGIALGGRAVAWSSSESAVARVDPSGLVTAVTPGVATVTASSEGRSAEAVVTVVEGGMIGPAGGTISAMGGEVIVAVSDRVIPTPTAVQVTRASVPADPGLVAGTAVTVSAGDASFGTISRLRMRLPDPLPPNAVVPLLRLAGLYRGTWLPLPDGVVDPVTRLVEARIDAPGTYAILIPQPSLRVYADRRSIRMGTAVRPSTLLAFDPTYRDVLAAEYNSVTAESAMKFEEIHPSATRFEWGEVDDLMSFAEARGISVHGHTLLWHDQVPEWITGGRWTPESLLEQLRLHIEAVVGRYRGRIESWDVANEVIADGGSGATAEGLRRTQWIDVIGPDVIDSAFVWANRADPAVKLYLNDYAVEHPVANAEKMSRVRALALRLRAAGVPIHGIGLQAHLSLDAPALAQLSQALAYFSDAGFDVRVSELDVRLPDGAGDSALQEQATIYRNVVRACLANPRCTAVSTWGFTDRHSWIPGFFPGYGRALPFDAQYRPKPTYAAMLEELRGTP